MANIQRLCIVTAFAGATVAAPGAAATAHPAPTIKPGAAVSFSHALRAPVEPNGAGVIELTINEEYETGAIQLVATSDGLDLATASRSTTISMDGASQHRWDVYFDAPAGGVYYIDFAATVEDAGGSATRSYSVAVQVGDQAAFAKPQADDVALDAAGNAVVIMEAEETISE